MKKKLTVIITSVLIAVAIFIIAIWAAINYAGDYVIHSLINSVDEQEIDDILSSMGEIPDISAVDASNEQEEIAEDENNTVEVVPKENEATENTTEISNESGHKPNNEHSATASNDNQKTDITVKTDNNNDAANKGSTEDNNNESKSLADRIEYRDKVAAIGMLSTKFSLSEINEYKNRYFKEGLSGALLGEVKSKLKARCTSAEIEQLKIWYNKYR